MHPLLLDELAAARVDELRRQASRERLACSASAVRVAARRASVCQGG